MSMRILLSATLLLAGAPSVRAGDPVKPERHPEKGGAAFVVIAVPWTSLPIGTGRSETFQGKLVFWPPAGPVFVAQTTLQLRDENGRTLDPQRGLTFRLNKDGDAAGGALDLSAGIPADVARRLVHETDFALVPLRMLEPNKMPSGGGSTAAMKEENTEHYHLSVSEKYVGAERISMTPLHRNFTRQVRTFRPSGHQLIDYILTYEDERDRSIMGSYGVRLLVHPTATLADGRKPRHGVLHCEYVQTFQLDWLKETPVIEGPEWAKRYEKWQDYLVDQLWIAIETEAIGNPFESPSAFALRALRVLDESSLGRLVNLNEGDPKTLAVIAPQLLDLPLNFDSERFVLARTRTEDPAERLLLAAAIALDGRAEPSFVVDARLGMHSNDPIVRQAAIILARALRDPALNADLGRFVARAQDDEEKIHALLALGSAGGDGARAPIEQVLAGATSVRLRAAATRALADLGDPDAPGLASPSAAFGTIDRLNGDFIVLLEDPVMAADAAHQVAELAETARFGEAKDILPKFGKALQNEAKAKGVENAVAQCARDWLARMAPVVPNLANMIEHQEYGPLARRIIHDSGRTIIAELIKSFPAKQGDERVTFAKLLGTTRDPRALELFRALSDSDDEADQDAANAGYTAARRE